MPATRALLAIAAVAGLAGQAAPPPAPVALRFHHLHYAVEDPGAALGEAVERLGGARAIVQGLGVGVQVGKEYVPFERAGAATAGAIKATLGPSTRTPWPGCASADWRWRRHLRRDGAARRDARRRGWRTSRSPPTISPPPWRASASPRRT